ncbi:hypothetical protein K461DRAFT_291431 [Myriangium duriaei CBS 260.36]|uniref:F-box domain-containing protein n=1 Tax=Myriangium duriaei CBS 260.36 TaxID=1168546 RepID=A0A9P4JCL1_9PEZI|nr:hypothetical protein K461DRAFT_291431 [Myriangium duriaei CBS 260.36]
MHLPEEVLHAIVLALHDSDVAIVSQVNTTFNRIAQQRLYHDLNLKLDHPAQLYNLLRTLTSQPWRASLVHSVKLSCWDPFDHVAQVGPGSPLTPKETFILIETTKTLPLTPALAENVRHGLQSGVIDAGLAMLIYICDQINSLEIIAHYFIGNSLFMSLLAETGSTVSKSPNRSVAGSSDFGQHYQMLSQVQVTHADAGDLQQLAPLIFLPSLQVFNGLTCNLSDGKHLSSNLKSNLRSLNLEESLVDADGMSDLLKVCPGLVSLSIGYGSAYVGYCELSWTAVGNVLRNYGSRLESLTLDTSTSDILFHTDSEGILGSLSALTSLQKLHLPVNALVPQSLHNNQHLEDMMPGSLRCLHVQSKEDSIDKEGLDVQLRQLMGSLKCRRLTYVKRTHERVWKSKSIALELHK